MSEWEGEPAGPGLPGPEPSAAEARTGARHLESVADAERVLEAVDRALARLDDGSYGSCEICGDTLDDDLLAADPTAARCGQHLPLAHSA